MKIALGTDIATSGPTSVDPWGDNGEELEHLVSAGLTPSTPSPPARPYCPR